jgi:flagellar basal body-associated protein FliL
VVGQFIEKTPMFLMWLTLCVVVGCVAIFALIALFGSLHKQTEAKAKNELKEGVNGPALEEQGHPL